MKDVSAESAASLAVAAVPLSSSSRDQRRRGRSWVKDSSAGCWGGMERLATDTAPRALTQRRTWLGSREKDGERGGRGFGTESCCTTKRNAPRGERAHRAAAGSEAGGDGTRRGKSAGRGAVPRAGVHVHRDARSSACVTGAAWRARCRVPAGLLRRYRKQKRRHLAGARRAIDPLTRGCCCTRPGRR